MPETGCQTCVPEPSRAWPSGVLLSFMLTAVAPSAASPLIAAGTPQPGGALRLIEGPTQPEAPLAGFDAQLADARSKLEQLAGLAEAITALREQLNSSLETNQRLAAELAEAKSELRARRSAALESVGRVAELSAASDAAAAQVEQLRQQLDTTEQKLLISETSRQEAETRVAALQATIDQLDEVAARQERELDAMARRFESSDAAKAEAERQRDALQGELDSARREVEALRAQVAAGARELERWQSEYEELETRAGAFSTAASEMVRAFEARLDAFDSTLAAAPPTLPAEGGGTSPPAANEGVAVDHVDAALDLAAATPQEGRPALAPAARDLIAELGAEETDLGLLILLPGGMLFETNGATVQDTALDRIADVATLIEAYDNPQVLILGHTDDMGQVDYNLALSQRRARAVKQVLVDRFGLDPDSLEAHGVGEARPIAGNHTRDGREANRRIELLIVDRDERIPPEMVAAP